MDNEISGTGNSYDYGFRIYNTRIGRFLSVDPLFQSYPYYTPYQFAGNTPIQAVDLDGLEILDYRANFTFKVSSVEMGGGNYKNIITLNWDNNNKIHSLFPEPYINPKGAKYIKTGSETKLEKMPFQMHPTGKLKTGQLGKQQKYDRTGKGYQWEANMNASADFLLRLEKGIIKGTETWNDLKNQDNLIAINAAAFVMYNVNKNTDLVNESLNKINFSDDFKNAVNSGEIDFSIENFKADVANYILDGRSDTKSDFQGFNFTGFADDYKEYTKAVYQLGEQLIDKENIDFKIKQPSRTSNAVKKIYNNVMAPPCGL